MDIIGTLVEGASFAFNWGLMSSAFELVSFKLGTFSVEFPSTAIFDQILQGIVETCVGKGDMVGTGSGVSLDASALFYSKGLFYHLAVIDFVVCILLGLLAFENAPNFITVLVNKCFKYGFWTTVFLNWRKIITAIGDSFLQIGSFDRDVTFGALMHPSELVTKGIEYAFGFIEFVVLHNLDNLSGKILFNIAISAIGSALIFAAFFLIALNLFITVAEFYICSALMLVFIPFALFEKTERFASQTFNLVICFGVRVMMLWALLRMGDGFFGTNSLIQSYFTFKDTPSLIVMFLATALSVIYAYLCCEAPQLAASVIQGSLHLDSNNAIMHGYGAMHMGNAAISTAAKGGAAIVGATQRGIDSARAASQDGNLLSGAFAGIRGFNSGLNSGIAKATMGGLEEGQAVYRAASGRTSGHESSDQPGYQITRDNKGNIINSQALQNYSSNNETNNNPNVPPAGGGSNNNKGASFKGAQGLNVTAASNTGSQNRGQQNSGAQNDSQEGNRGPVGDFRHN